MNARRRVLAVALTVGLLLGCRERPYMTGVELRPTTGVVGSHVVSRAFAYCGGTTWHYSEEPRVKHVPGKPGVKGDIPNVKGELPEGLEFRRGELIGFPKRPGQWL